MQTTKRSELVDQANKASIVLIKAVSDLIDVVGFYTERYEVITKSDEIKTNELTKATIELANLVQRLGAEVVRWRNDEERVISRLGIELEVLNELFATLDATMMFFVRENIDPVFDFAAAQAAHADLIRCNRLL